MTDATVKAQIILHAEINLILFIILNIIPGMEDEEIPKKIKVDIDYY